MLVLSLSCSKKSELPESAALARHVVPELVDGKTISKPEKGLVRIEFGESCGDIDAVLFVNGKKVFSGVLRIAPDGVADSVTLKSAKSPLELAILLKGRKWESKIDLGKGQFILIEYREGEVQIRQSKTSFPHL
jgi:hypothetical protein